MASAQPTTQHASGAGPRPSSRGEPSRSWVPPIPAPLQRLFDSVPLVTYPPNDLPVCSSAPNDLPTLHVFTSAKDAARGAPSFNPSCLKWQTYLRFAGIRHHLAPSTNHASPTGSLPFLLPALPSSPEHRLDARHLLPIPSSRLDSYARQHSSLPPFSSATATATTSTSTTPAAPQQQTPDQRHHRQQAYQALLDTPIRNAWLYALYISPANEALLRHLYVDPVSRSELVRQTILQQLKTAARAEVAKAGDATSTGWKLSGNIGDLLTWALGGRTVVDPEKVYGDARRAFGALETLLSTGIRESHDDDDDDDDNNRDEHANGQWFFGSAHPTLFDASVFSYAYLILFDEYKQTVLWEDDTLRKIVQDCPLLMAHARRILELYW